MAPELNCQEHGPYDSSYGTCPVCQAESGHPRPAHPAPLDEDDLPTEVGPGPVMGGGLDEDNLPTEVVGGGRGVSYDLEDDELTDVVRGGFLDDETEIEFQETGALSILWAKDGPRRGKIQRISDGTVVGRKSGGLILDDPKVSNPHAKFKFENDEFEIWDFGSKNGTFVNGERIRSATVLKENDDVKIGDTTFVLKILDTTKD